MYGGRGRYTPFRDVYGRLYGEGEGPRLLEMSTAEGAVRTAEVGWSRALREVNGGRGGTRYLRTLTVADTAKGEIHGAWGSPRRFVWRRRRSTIDGGCQ